MESASEQAPKVRELFVDELVEVQGGERLEDLIGFDKCQHWHTTMACGEEGPPCPSGC
jgi:hypothetical protein